jgi:O-antigen/teichoic acid export membrane protein
VRTINQAFFAALSLYGEYFVGLIVSLIIARSLIPSEYGIYSSIIWIAAIIQIAINAGGLIIVTKYVAEFCDAGSDKLSTVVSYLKNIHYLRMAVTGLLAIATASFALNTEISLTLFAVLVVTALLKAHYMFQIAVYKGLRDFKVVAATSLFANITNLVLVSICAIFFASLKSFIILYCIACAVYWISSLKIGLPENIRASKANLDSKTKKRMLTQLASSVVIVFIGALIYRQSQVFVLEKSSFLEEAGFFNIGYLLSLAAITLVPGVYKEVLLPKITRAVTKGNVESEVIQAETYLLPLCLLVAVLGAFYADVVVGLLYGKAYMGASIVLQWMLCFQVLLTLSEGPNLTIVSKDKQHQIMILNLCFLLIGGAISWLIVPSYGMNGALGVFGILTAIKFISYRVTAQKIGYKGLDKKTSLKICLCAALAYPSLLGLDLILPKLVSVPIGAFLFTLIFVTLLIKLRCLDASLSYLLKDIRGKAPQPIKRYIDWSVRCLEKPA